MCPRTHLPLGRSIGSLKIVLSETQDCELAVMFSGLLLSKLNPWSTCMVSFTVPEEADKLKNETAWIHACRCHGVALTRLAVQPQLDQRTQQEPMPPTSSFRQLTLQEMDVHEFQVWTRFWVARWMTLKDSHNSSLQLCQCGPCSDVYVCGV